jgi:hypothetical protein
MPSPNKNKGGKKTTTKLPKEIEEFLRKYSEWYKKYQANTEGSNPSDPPPPPPGNDDDDGD